MEIIFVIKQKNPVKQSHHSLGELITLPVIKLNYWNFSIMIFALAFKVFRF